MLVKITTQHGAKNTVDVYTGMLLEDFDEPSGNVFLIYIIDLNMKCQVKFYPGQYNTFLATKKIYKNIILDNAFGATYCELEIL